MPAKKKLPPDPLIQLADAVLARGAQTIEEVRSAMIDTLQPRSAFEMRRAQEIAALEIELEQHRRMHDASLVSKMQELAAGAFADFEIKSVSRKAHPEAHAKARALFSDDVAERDAALDVLSELGVTQVALAASAHAELASSLAHHQIRIADLIKRRRELFEDYEMLRVTAARNARYG